MNRGYLGSTRLVAKLLACAPKWRFKIVSIDGLHPCVVKDIDHGLPVYRQRPKPTHLTRMAGYIEFD
jgi:hypothetical protein